MSLYQVKTGGRKKIQRILYSWPILLLLLVLVALSAKAVYGVSIKYRESAANLERVESAVAELKAREVKLDREIASLETKEGVEDEIREKFRLRKEGEKLIILLDDEADTIRAENPKQSLLQLFFGNLKFWK